MDINVIKVNYADSVQAGHLVELLSYYALDTMGGGEDLSDFTKENLIARLSKLPHAFSLLAYHDNKPVGLMNCFDGFSTFACAPIVNIHDVVVLDQYRGKGVCRKMFDTVESIAKVKECCKLTLEVLPGNIPAKAAYHVLGFTAYELNSEQYPDLGCAEFWQKYL